MERFRYILGFAIVIIVPLCFGQLEDDSVCDNVNGLQVLDDITFRHPDIDAHVTVGVSLNDRHLKRTWYRTIKEGRQYMLSDKIAHVLHCSTLYAMYLKDTHPKPEDISEEPISLTVCVSGFLGTCPERNIFQVRVRKCDRELVYELHSDFESSAFCLREGDMLYNAGVEAPRGVDLGQIKALPELQYSTTMGQNSLITYKPKIVFRCHFTNTSEYFYSVKWKINERTVMRLGPSKNSDDLCLPENEFIDKPLDFGVQCLVTVSAGERGTGKQTDAVPSDVYLATVKVYNTELKQSGHGQISISLTLPYGCVYSEGFKELACKGQGNFMIRETEHTCEGGNVVNVKNSSAGSSDGSSAEERSCTNGFDLIPHDEIWNPEKIFNFTIVTADYTYQDDAFFTLQLEFGSMAENAFWSKRSLPDIKVRVTDRNSHENKICTSRVDPHMKTADGYTYQLHEVGTFVLYRNEKYKIEVQQTTYLCGRSDSAACTCRIEIRAGKDVFMANICAGTPNFFGFPRCDDGGILRIEKVNSDDYIIYTPIGTKILLNIKRRQRFINTNIQMAPKDKNNVVGLCGYYDGNKTNDLLHKDNTSSEIVSTYLPNHVDFVNSWRVAGKSTFLCKQELKGWVDMNGLYCECRKLANNEREVICRKNDKMDCSIDNEITKTKCLFRSSRKKRSPRSHEKEMNRLLSLMEPAMNHKVKKREVRDSKISESEATEVCSKMVNESVAFNSYKHMTATENPDVTMRQCIFDVRACEDKSLASVHLDVVNSVAKGIMKEVPKYVETHKKESEFFVQNSCPSNCSNRGVCSKDGVCICSKYHHGAICDIDERIPPVIEDVEGSGMCDTSDGDECKCFYFRGDNFLESMKCIIHTTQISISGEKINVTTDEVAGGYEDVFTGVCCIPEENIFSKDMFVREHDIAISSDGAHYSANNIMYVYDSTCQKLETMPRGKMSFTLTAGYCFIEHSCFPDQYYFLADNNTCLLCNVTTDVHQWIETKLETCIPTTTQTTTTTKSNSMPSIGIENALIIENHPAFSTSHTFIISTTSENTQNSTHETLSDINPPTKELPITTSKESSTKTTTISDISSGTKMSTTTLPVTEATESSSKRFSHPVTANTQTSTTSSPNTKVSESSNKTTSEDTPSTKTLTKTLPITTATENSSKTTSHISSNTQTSASPLPVTTSTESSNKTTSDISSSTQTSTTSLSVTMDTASPTNGTSETFSVTENAFSSLAPAGKEIVEAITVASTSQTTSNPVTAITTNASKSFDDQGYVEQAVKTSPDNSTSTNTPFQLNYTSSAISSTTKAKKRCKERIIQCLRERLRKQLNRKQRKLDKIKRISKLIVRLERLIKHHEEKSN